MKKENKKAAHAATITTKKKYTVLSQMLQNQQYFSF